MQTRQHAGSTPSWIRRQADSRLHGTSRGAVGTIGRSRLCDFTRKEDIDALVAFARECYGRVDVGINAMGRGLLRPFEDTSEETMGSSGGRKRYGFLIFKVE
jgi:NAD(P)-dependent dehydrogenase (short-subunit alcohol dehydrogenase family)